MKIMEPDFKHFDGDARTWVLVGEYEASNQATLDVELPEGYWSYILILDDLLTSSDGDVGYMRTSMDGGVNFDVGSADYAWVVDSGDASMVRGADLADTEIELTQVNDKCGNVAGEGFTGIIDIYNGGSSNSSFMGRTYLKHRDETAEPVGSMPFATTCYFMRIGLGRVTHVQFLFATGNVASGTVKVYGLR